jgi:hypothetical protein
MEDNAGMVTLVRRLMMEAGRLHIKLDAAADSEGHESEGSSIPTSPSDGSGSSDGESDEESDEEKSEMDKELLGSSESEGSSLR